jgi:hypothetical protein
MQEQQLIPPRPGYDLNVILYPTYSRLLQETRERYLSGYHGMDQYGAMYFETSDFKGKPVLFTDTNYVFNNEYYNTQRMKPGKCSGSVPVKLPNGQEYVLRLKIYFRTFRDILWSIGTGKRRYTRLLPGCVRSAYLFERVVLQHYVRRAKRTQTEMDFELYR